MGFQPIEDRKSDVDIRPELRNVTPGWFSVSRRMAKLISYLGFQILATTVSTMFDGVAKVGSSVDGRRLKITY